MKIGILQAGHSPEGLIADFGDYGEVFPRLLDGHGFSFDVYSVVDGIFPDSIYDADGWLITGSRHGAYEYLGWIPPLEVLLRAAYEYRIPLVGICFGHQVLAQALGGKVEKFNGGWTVGPTLYHIEGEDLELYAWHQDQVVSLPKGARVIGTAKNCENAALAYNDQALTFQPHPEFSRGFVEGLIDTRGRGVVPDALLNAAKARLGAEINADRVALKIAEFFKQPRG